MCALDREVFDAVWAGIEPLFPVRVEIHPLGCHRPRSLRRNTDRSTIHRLAQFALAVTFLLTAKLIDWRNRWSPSPACIR
jgi:hypothetical protein